MKKEFRTITHANYRHYSYVYAIMRNDGMTKLNVAAAMNISFRNADLFEYDYTNSLKKGLDTQIKKVNNRFIEFGADHRNQNIYQ